MVKQPLRGMAALLALAWALLLLPPSLVAAGWADVAFTLPGEAEVLPQDAYRPIRWTQTQVDSMKRRALLQQQAEGLPAGISGTPTTQQLPVCELMLAYRVVDITASNFTSIITLTNNRELDLSHWQVVWRFEDYRHVLLSSTQGATQLSPGSTSGAPARLVDSFEPWETIPGAGGTYSFLADAAIVNSPSPPSPSQSLGIDSVNINGMQCSLAGEASMQYSQCVAQEQSGGMPAALVIASGGPTDGGAPVALIDASPGTSADPSGSSGACWEHFCCGVVLLDPSVAPPPAPQPPAPPAPPVAAPQPSPPTAASLPPMQPPNPPAMVYAPGAAVHSNSSSNTELNQSRRNKGVVVPAAAAGGAAAAALLLTSCVLLVRRHLRRSSPDSPASQFGPDSKAAAAACPAGTPLATPQPSTLLEGGATLSSILSPIMLLQQQRGSGSTADAERRMQLTITGSVPAVTSSSLPAGSGSLPAGTPLSEASSISKVGSGSSEGSPLSSSGSIDLAKDVVLHEQLGSGAFGTVYRGSWQGRPVAVKVMQTACGTRSRELDSFKQEARVLEGLRHPHIVSLLAACTVPPNICIIEELVEGGSLHTRLHGAPGARRRSPLPYGQLLSVAADVAEAMCYLHPRIVHRDLKSQNVLLDAQGRAKVCDFGIAKFKDRTFVSTVGAQAGTPAYMAPEMFGGDRVSEKVDVFSFAVLCWEMLTGEVPWRDLPGQMQIIFTVGVMCQRLPVPEDCPEFLRQLIQQCWAEDPAERPGFQAIRQLLQAELARVAADVALQERRVAYRSTVSETDASSAAAGCSAEEPSSGKASQEAIPAGGDSSRGSSWVDCAAKLPSTGPAVQLSMASPFAATAAPFSSSSEGSATSP